MNDELEQGRLARILASGAVIPFVENIADRENPAIRWSVYGAIDTNEIIVRAQANDRVVLKAERSALEVPAMADRLFGLDVLDQQTAARLADEIWELHGRALSDAEKGSIL